jgi:FAD:protein FMN transferase
VRGSDDAAEDCDDDPPSAGEKSSPDEKSSCDGCAALVAADGSDAGAGVAAELFADVEPIEPSNAMTPNASANVPRAVAMIWRRSRAMRPARSRRARCAVARRSSPEGVLVGGMRARSAAAARALRAEPESSLSAILSRLPGSRFTLAGMDARRERVERFDCFGAIVSLRASGDREVVRLGLRRAREIAEDLHRRLTRFDAASDLCRLNADPRALVPAAALVRRFAEAVRWAGTASDGLVDATCLPAVEAAGYREHWTPAAATDAWAVRGAASPLHDGWASVGVEDDAVRRPPGTRLDSGGLGKGLAADLMAAALAACATWAIDCGGDLRIGGLEAYERDIEIAAPDGGPAIERLRLVRGAVATSGVTCRVWAGGGHHLIDPRTGRPADTGIVQATAVAPTGLAAEVRAKTALLAGPGGAAHALPGGGVVVTADGLVHVVERAGVSA